MKISEILLLVTLIAISQAASTVSYGFSGMDAEEFAGLIHKFPLPAILRAIQNMENNTQLILRPFNFGSAKDYEEHTGLGKNTNVKGKSCYLDDQTLNGKITYIQSNPYTGRTQAENKITYIGKYLARDKLSLKAFRSIAKKQCKKWSSKQTDDIKKDIVSQLNNLSKEDPDLQSAIDYVNARYIFKVDIDGTQYLTTEIVTTKTVDSKSKLPVTEEHCSDGHCSYTQKAEKTNKVDVLAYQALNLKTCQFKEFELVADMDILTIHFPHELAGRDIDQYQYFDDPTGQNCQNSFKMAFGISPQISMVYDYVHKLMEATAEWGMIRHSIEALNFCFTQPYEKGGKFYLKLSRSIIGKGTITVIKESDDTQIIPDTVRQWVLAGKCTPLNPAWLFVSESQPKALMWNKEEVQTILQGKAFLLNSCPTYSVIYRISNDGATIPPASVKRIKDLRSHHLYLRHSAN